MLQRQLHQIHTSDIQRFIFCKCLPNSLNSAPFFSVVLFITFTLVCYLELDIISCELNYPETRHWESRIVISASQLTHHTSTEPFFNVHVACHTINIGQFIQFSRGKDVYLSVYLYFRGKIHEFIFPKYHDHDD